jgi:hypothetical protein
MLSRKDQLPKHVLSLQVIAQRDYDKRIAVESNKVSPTQPAQPDQGGHSERNRDTQNQGKQ